MPAPHDLICSVLRDEQAAWPWAIDEAAAIQRLRRHAARHGVEALLHARLTASGWPGEILGILRSTAIQHAVWEMRHQQLLAKTLAALHRAGIDPVLIKGTALAYSLYPNPVLRSRGDTDLIIADADKH